MRARLVLLSVLCLSCAIEHPEAPTPVPPRFDLDGDGAADLLVRQSWDGRVRRLSIDGTLGETVLETEYWDEVERLGDVNGDGRDDLLVYESYSLDGRVHVHLGRADGTADPTPFHELRGIHFGATSTGDVNGDGLADWLIKTYPEIMVYGDSDTAVEVEWDLEGAPLLALDLDGDGTSDLVTRQATSDDVVHRVWVGGSEEALEFVRAGAFVASLPDPANPARDLLVERSVVAADVDFISGIWAWNGTGFDPVALPLPPGMPFDRGQVLGDEAIDSLFAVQTATECRTYVGAPGRVLATLSGSCSALGWRPIAVAGDLDMDGFEEIIQWTEAPGGADGLRILRGGPSALTETGTALPVFEEAFGPFLLETLRPAGDLNGDGRTDLFGLDGRGCAHVALGGPRLIVETTCRELEWGTPGSEPIVLGSLDGRPGDEIGIRGVGIFSLARGVPELLTAPGEFSLEDGIGDIDGDGFVDLLAFHSVVRGGPGLLTDRYDTILIDAVTPTHLGDVNGDGVDDLALATSIRFGGPDVASRADDVDLRTLPGESVTRIFGVGDRDGDGIADIGVELASRMRTVIYRLRGGVLEELEELPLRIIRGGDIDGDGRDELIEGVEYVVLGPPTVHLGSGEALPLPVGLGRYRPADLDGDGRDELVFGDELVASGRTPTVIRRWDGSALHDVRLEALLGVTLFRLEPVR